MPVRAESLTFAYSKTTCAFLGPTHGSSPRGSSAFSPGPFGNVHASYQSGATMSESPRTTLSGTPSASPLRRKSFRALWREREEVGSPLGISIVAGVAAFIGRRAARALLYVVTFSFYLTRPHRVEACIAFRRLACAPTAPLDICIHLLTFAQTALAGFLFLRGDLEPFRFYQIGPEHILSLREDKKGATLLGCHLGSFEAMRAVARVCQLIRFVV